MHPVVFGAFLDELTKIAGREKIVTKGVGAVGRLLGGAKPPPLPSVSERVSRVLQSTRAVRGPVGGRVQTSLPMKMQRPAAIREGGVSQRNIAAMGQRFGGTSRQMELARKIPGAPRAAAPAAAPPPAMAAKPSLRRGGVTHPQALAYEARMAAMP
jgi:hypothetical protein